jgi:Outer membrane protein beta-barrel domain
MDMLENDFDEFMRLKFENFSSGVPDDMWERINKSKDKDRKFIIFWICGLTAILLICGTILYFTHQSSGSADHKVITTAGKGGTPGAHKRIQAIEIRKDVESSNSKSNSTDSEYVKATGLGRETMGYHANAGYNSGKVAFNSSILAKGYASKETEKRTESRSLEAPKKNGLSKESPNENINYPHEPDDGNKSNNDKGVKSGSKDVIALVSVQASSAISSKYDSDSNKKASNNTVHGPRSPKLSNNDKHIWALDIFASPDFYFVNRISTNDPIYAMLLNSSKLQISYSAGARLNRYFGDHFSSKIGLQYSRLNYRFQSDSINGSTTHLNGIDVPILFGYEVGDQRFRIGFNTGIVLNVISWTNEPASYPADQYYKKQAGISLYFGANFAYALNKDLACFAEPYFRYQLSNMIYSNQPFSQRIDVGGISLGLRYYFKKKTK